MNTKEFQFRSNKRTMIILGSLVLGALITAAVLLALGAYPVQSAALNEPQAPDAQAKCNSSTSGSSGWRCEDVQNPLFGVDNLTDRYFRYNPGGTPCLAYGNDGLYYACYNETLDEWVGADGTSNLLIDASPLVGDYAALDFNSNGVPFISYYDALNASLKLAYFNSGSWTIRTIVNTATSCPWIDVLPRQGAETAESSLDKLQSGGSLPEGKIYQSPARLQAPQFDPVIGVGKYSSISIDDKNNVHISFQDEANRTLRYYFWDTGAVERCRTIDDVGGPGYQTGLWSSIATYGTEPKIHISYFHDIYDQLRYARSIEYDKFEIYEITGRDLPNHGNGPYSSIAVDNDGTPNISYYRWFRDNPNKGDLYRAHVVAKQGDNDCTPKNYDDGFWQCDRLTNQGDQGGYTSIAIDDDDDERISYYDFLNQDLKMWGPNGGTLDDDNNVGLFTSIDTFSDDKIGIAYLDDTDGQLIVIEKDGSDAWEKLGSLDYVTTQSNVGLYTSVAIRQWDNIPFISYYNLSNEFLKYAWRVSAPSWPSVTSQDWTYGTVTGEYTGGTFSSIAISNSLPVIANYNTEDNDLMFAKYSITANKWITDEIDTDGDVGQYVDLVVDSKNIPHVSYYDADDQNLKYAYWQQSPAKWISRTWETSALDGLFTSIDVSPNDRPYIAFYDYTNLEVKLVYQTPLGGWSAPVVIDTGIGKIDRPPEDIEAYLSLDYEDVPDPDKDQVHVSYYDSTTQPSDVKDLNYWRAEIDPSTGLPTQKEKIPIDTTGDVGMYNSISVFDPNGTRYICYYDETNGFLKVAEWLGEQAAPSWTTFVVDNNNRDTGLYCSTAFGSTGWVGISYYDKTRGTLRFAYHFPNKIYGPFVWK